MMNNLFAQHTCTYLHTPSVTFNPRQQWSSDTHVCHVASSPIVHVLETNTFRPLFDKIVF